MTIARKLQINLKDTVYYHCIARCVRRSFLYGNDRETGRDYNHRKGWVISQLQSLCSVFAIKVCAYAIMSNHYHLVLCVEPEAVEGWTDEEVINRVKHINTLRMHGTFASKEEGGAKEKLPAEKIAAYREKLIDISSFMGALNEYLARKANREDECKGRFWESRFKSMALLDDSALLACMAYVDLNPIKAGMASLLEESDFTSIQERIVLMQREADDARTLLNPGLKEHLGIFAAENVSKPHIPCTWSHYHQLVKWTQEQLLGKKASALPLEAQVFLEGLAIETDKWLAQSKFLERDYSWAVGSFKSLKEMLQKKGLHWIRGMRRPIEAKGRRGSCARLS